MKKLLIATLITAAFSMAVMADTVAWIDFDSLGDVGTSISRNAVVENKANPGTLDATVVAVHHGDVAKDSDSAYMLKSAIGYPLGRHIYDPVIGRFVISDDGAVQFTTPKPDNTYDRNEGAALHIDDTSGKLNAEKFTLEMIIRIDEQFADDGTYQTIVSKTVSNSSTDYAWEVAWYNHSLVFRAYNTFVDNNDAVAWSWGNIADGEWHHIAIVVDPSANATYPVLPYLDYAARDRARYSSIGGAGPMVIGARYNVSSLTYSHPARCVAISEFRFSNAPLSADMFLKARNVPIGTTLAHVKFDDGTVNAADEYGTLCAGVNAAVSGGSPATFSDDVPGARIVDGVDGAIISRNNTKSLYFANSRVAWTNANDIYNLTKTLAGEDRTSWTVEFFMKATSEQATWARIMSALGGGSWSAWSPYIIEAKGTPNRFYLCGLSGKPQIKFNTDVCDGKWHHVAFSFEPNNDRPDPTNSVARLYIDYGKFYDEAQTPNIFKYPENLHFVLGGVGKSTDTGYFGLIDELRISDGALTPSQFLRAEPAPGFTILVR